MVYPVIQRNEITTFADKVVISFRGIAFMEPLI